MDLFVVLPSVLTVTPYIDPGTGSMLFTLLIGLLSTGYFFVKKYFIKIKFLLSGGRVKAGSETKLPYVIFSDHKRYWTVFKPICDEFERRGIPCAYWTASPDDPALDEPYEHVTCEFIGEENKAFARLNMMSATICLSTTPGLEVYQWKRSRDVDWYAHILHSAGVASGYRMFGIDFYDAMLLSGAWHVDEVRELERLRQLPPKEIEVVGCPYLDVMAERLKHTPPVKKDRTCVLLAPSWGESAILARYGRRIIDALIKTGFEIIVRPHPQSMTSEAEMLGKLMEEFPDGQDVTWNFDNDNFDVLNRADIMISDFSGVVLDYALVFDKPVVYAEGQLDHAVYDSAWLEKPIWSEWLYTQLGATLSEDQFPHMREVLEGVLADPGAREVRDTAREGAWQHRGESAARTVDYLVRKYAELTA